MSVKEETAADRLGICVFGAPRGEPLIAICYCGLVGLASVYTAIVIRRELLLPRLF